MLFLTRYKARESCILSATSSPQLCELLWYLHIQVAEISRRKPYHTRIVLFLLNKLSQRLYRT